MKTGVKTLVENTGTIGNSGSDTYNNLTSTDSGQDIHNAAFNPNTEPSTISPNELGYINEQRVDKFGKANTMSGSISNSNTQTNNLETNEQVTKGVLDGYAELLALLESDVTEDFLSKFSKLFKRFVSPYTELYVTEGE